MLEAAIAKTTNPRLAVKAQGDVVAVALAGHPWTPLERERFEILKWKDEALEAQMRKDRRAILGNPYADRTERVIGVRRDGKPRTITVQARRSRLTVQTQDLQKDDVVDVDDRAFVTPKPALVAGKGVADVG